MRFFSIHWVWKSDPDTHAVDVVCSDCLSDKKVRDSYEGDRRIECDDDTDQQCDLCGETNEED